MAMSSEYYARLCDRFAELRARRQRHGGTLGPEAQTAEAEATRQELLDYEIRVSEDGHDSYGAFKTGKHDDLVTALGLAVQKPRRGWGSI